MSDPRQDEDEVREKRSAFSRRKLLSRRQENGLLDEEPGTLHIKAFGFDIKAKGRDIVFVAMLLAIVFLIGGFGWIHHSEMQLSSREMTKNHQVLTQQVNEMIYILSLPQSRRDELNISMPETLRARMRGNRRFNNQPSLPGE